MSIELSSERLNYLNSVLYKAQFQQKLGLKYKLLTGTTVLIGIFVYSVLGFLPEIWKAWLFLAGFFAYSKWFFSLTRDKGFYEPFLIKTYAGLKRRVLLKMREKAKK